MKLKKRFLILEIDYDPELSDPPDEWIWNELLDLTSRERVRVNMFTSELDMLNALMYYQLKGQVWHGSK